MHPMPVVNIQPSIKMHGIPEVRIFRYGHIMIADMDYTVSLGLVPW